MRSKMKKKAYKNSSMSKESMQMITKKWEEQ